MRFIYRALPWSTDYSRYESKVLHWSGCVPIMAAILCLIPLYGCRSVELGSAPEWVVENAASPQQTMLEHLIESHDIPADRLKGKTEAELLAVHKKLCADFPADCENCGFLCDLAPPCAAPRPAAPAFTVDESGTKEAFRECHCSDHRAELQALQFRVAGIEQRESLRPFRETPKSQPSVPVSQPAQRYEGDCPGGVCGPRLAPRVFGGRIFGRR